MQDSEFLLLCTVSHNLALVSFNYCETTPYYAWTVYGRACHDSGFPHAMKHS